MATTRKSRRAKLTKTVADRAEYTGTGANGRCVIWDTKRTGFGLRIYPSGRKAFVFSYRNASGQKRLLTLGDFGALTVDKARELADEKAVEVASDVDPLQKRQEARQRGLTLAEYIGPWLDKGGRNGSRQTQRDDRRRLESHVLPVLGHKPLADLTRRDMEDLHARISGAVEANRTLELLRAVFNKVPEGIMARNPAAGSWRSRKGPGNRERSRTRFLRKSEHEAFAKAVAAESDPYVRAAIWLLLLTGARSASELLRLHWDDVDFDNDVVTFYQPKTDEPNPLPLSAPGRRILEDLPRERGNPYVFPSPRNPGEHRRTLRKPWEKLTKAAGIEDLTLHDLRRSAGAFMAAAGVPLLHIGAVLGHKSEDVTTVYARLSGDETRAAVNVLGERVEELRRGAATAEEDAREAEIAALKARLAELGAS